MCGAAHLPAKGPARLSEAAEALSAGAQAIMQYGGAKKGSRTMLDALLPAAVKLAEEAERGAESWSLFSRRLRVFCPFHVGSKQSRAL